MSRLWIVIDTNVLISALLNPLGWEAQLVELIAYRVFERFVSVEVLAEYRGVLNRAKFSHLDPSTFLDCSMLLRPAYIVTGNLKHFHRSYKTTKITTARQLLTLLTEKE